ncbi:tRNA (adenosine(37)-N6)-dimethylallyltransferase MiaA [Rossellomorea aquimaris]|uniref:tRNA (adenosine(37)-N6)-dimethylallyltransferase MiaA n=1 Tax=Rossellomorea aquimaris TaxID=189382 RepID=UPI001CD1CF1C|nr:tRNA (adenosine(37)-N6)-dimethylallyltransferase MiaA [Rossellomorea aquimaris]MCA1053618.1 tRNA (adenosine(37)-N6)-dimethylallyltransferase MiaA [Rossellomorea aquimaris]
MSDNTKQKVIVLIGPTAVGKTNTSIQLAKRFDAEIISGDSMQIYRGMDIGTAKIKEEEMQGVPHHLIDIKDPEDSFSTAEFQKLVREKISDIHSRGRIPMIVGGTGLYIQSVLYDYQFTDAPGNPEYRSILEKQVKDDGIEPLYEQLKRIDPEAAGNIHPNNVRRVIRALEIFHSSGKTMTDYQEKQTHDLLYDAAIIGLSMDRQTLYDRINKRVDLMIEEGLLDEVKTLFDKGVKDVQSVQAIGYKEMYQYLEGNVSLERASEQLKQNSRRYAKRQLTWFRNKMDVTWFDLTDVNNQGKIINEISEFIAGKLQLKSNK